MYCISITEVAHDKSHRIQFKVASNEEYFLIRGILNSIICHGDPLKWSFMTDWSLTRGFTIVFNCK